MGHLVEAPASGSLLADSEVHQCAWVFLDMSIENWKPTAAVIAVTHIVVLLVDLNTSASYGS